MAKVASLPRATSTSNQPPLFRLPLDLIPTVFEGLTRCDILSLCLVCKDLRPLAENLLYSSISLEWSVKGRPPPIVSLTRTILGRPDLAAQAQCLSLCGNRAFLNEQVEWDIYHRDSPLPWYNPRIDVNPNDLTSAIAFVEASGLDFAQVWAEELRAGTIDAFVAILLVQLHNLATLRLEADFAINLQLSGLVLRYFLCNSAPGPLGLAATPFLHLRDITITPGDQPQVQWKSKDEAPMPRNFADVLPLLYLPEIQSLWVAVEILPQDVLAWGTGSLTAPMATSITSLRLEFVREWDLGRILAATPALQTLHWTCFCRDDFADVTIRDPVRGCVIGGSSTVHLGKIIEGIEAVKDTLKDFTIRGLSQPGPGFAPNCPILQSYGSLDGLSKLRVIERLELPVPFLLGSFGSWMDEETQFFHHFLPSSLETLVISDDFYESAGESVGVPSDHMQWQALQPYLTDVRLFTPRLKHLMLELRQTDDDWGPGKRQQLRELCGTVGVKLEVIKPEGDSEDCTYLPFDSSN